MAPRKIHVNQRCARADGRTRGTCLGVCGRCTHRDRLQFQQQYLSYLLHVRIHRICAAKRAN